MTANQNPIKKKVLVTITKEIEIEIMPSMFSGMTEEQFLDEWRKGLWPVENMDEVICYAARMAATYGGGVAHDGIGLLDGYYSTYTKEPDVKFSELSDECEEEILP